MEAKKSNREKSIRPYTKYVLGLLWLVALFRLIDLQIIAVLLESIRAEMGFTDTQLGLLSGLAFAIFYACLGIPIAWLSDRYSRKNILSICLGLWSLMTAMCSTATGFITFFIARMGVGVGEAGGYPPSASILSDYFPPEKRGFAFSVLGSAIPVGIFVSFIVGGYINEYYGWRAAYLAVGVPGIILAILIKFTLREPQRGMNDAEGVEPYKKEPLQVTVQHLISNKCFLLVIMGAAFHTMAATGSGIWLPSFLIRVHDMQSSEVGIYMGVMYGVGGLIGTLMGGILADRLTKKYSDTRYFMRVCSVSMLALLPLVCIVFTVQRLDLALFILFFVIILMHMNIGPSLALVQNLVGVSRRSMSQAFNVLLSNLVGLSLGPLIVGMLSDKYSPVYGDAALGYSIMGIYLFGYSIAAVFFILAEKKNCEVKARTKGKMIEE